MASIDPTPEQLQQFLGEANDGEPIVMINLLRYHEQAQYPTDAGAEPCSGREAYQRYGEGAGPLIAKAGARPIWMGTALGTVIAPEGEAWDDAILAEYPSGQAFIDMVSSPDYQAISFHRTAALADSRLIATRTGLDLLGR